MENKAGKDILQLKYIMPNEANNTQLAKTFNAQSEIADRQTNQGKRTRMSTLLVSQAQALSPVLFAQITNNPKRDQPASFQPSFDAGGGELRRSLASRCMLN
jgi:hypothetical protein